MKYQIIVENKFKYAYVNGICVACKVVFTNGEVTAWSYFGHKPDSVTMLTRRDFRRWHRHGRALPAWAVMAEALTESGHDVFFRPGELTIYQARPFIRIGTVKLS